MMKPFLIAVAAVWTTVVLGAGPSLAADESEFALSVKRDRAWGASVGTLRITTSGIRYDTQEQAEARNWAYEDIKQIQILAPTRLAVLTYEDQGRLKLGADRRFEFAIRGGRLGPELVAFILSRTDRPVVTAVLPPISKEPLYRLPVKHERQGRGTDGVLLLYDDALVYGTDREGESRYWRFSDVFAVLPLDRDRLQVLAYEGGAGTLRPFTFELKSPLPDEFRRVVWAKVNPPAPLAR
jgi:hypothetical protein